MSEKTVEYEPTRCDHCGTVCEVGTVIVVDNETGWAIACRHDISFRINYLEDEQE